MRMSVSIVEFQSDGRKEKEKRRRSFCSALELAGRRRRRRWRRRASERFRSSFLVVRFSLFVSFRARGDRGEFVLQSGRRAAPE
jgi:hypothetical protein